MIILIARDYNEVNDTVLEFTGRRAAWREVRATGSQELSEQEIAFVSGTDPRSILVSEVIEGGDRETAESYYVVAIPFAACRPPEWAHEHVVTIESVCAAARAAYDY